MNRTYPWWTFALIALLAAWIGLAPAARAGLIGTEQAVQGSQAESERARVNALVARPEVAKQLQSLGLPPESARARVDALTDQEVHVLATRLDSLPAGGNFSDFQWIMIIIGVVIIALLV